MAEVDKIIKEISPFYKKKSGASVEHNITYNSSTETLEPVYFWIFDFMNTLHGGDVTKLVDNFAASPGSGHFSELQGKASQMQQEASRVLGTVNQILRGILNLIYDMKEFRIKLKQYDDANDKTNQSIREGGILALKQMWLDKVDVARGQGSIHAMTTSQLNFVTLRDAFMVAKSSQEVDKIDLNERVKKVLKPRVREFFQWKEISEQELRKRYEIERAYLKGQVDALKLNVRWAKPYLKAAQQLTQNENLMNKPELVNVFNTVMLELLLMGKNAVNVKTAAIEDGDLPLGFIKMKKLRTYYAVTFIDINFRGIPSKAQQHYVFGGKADVSFKAYTLNEDELLLLKEKLGQSDIDDLNLIEGMTEDSLGALKLDLEELLPETKKEEKKKSGSDNPFSALFDFSSLMPKKDKKDKKEQDKEKLKMLKEKGVRPDTYHESFLRNLAEANAINTCYTVFDIYKKAHGMESLPYMIDKTPNPHRTKAEELFGFGKSE